MKIAVVGFLFSFIFLPFSSTNYETFENANYGIKLKKPKKWVYWNKEEIRSNIGKVKFSESELKEILSNNNQSINIATFAKYPKSAHKKLVPVVYVIVRPNSTSDMSEFAKVIGNSVNSLKRYFKEFKVIEEPDVITLNDGTMAVYISSEAVMENDRGQEIHSKSRMYAIPKDGYFLQINFTDGFGKENCQEIFDEIIASIEVD